MLLSLGQDLGWRMVVVPAWWCEGYQVVELRGLGSRIVTGPITLRRAVIFARVHEELRQGG
jgi:hypothetical protein